MKLVKTSQKKKKLYSNRIFSVINDGKNDYAITYDDHHNPIEILKYEDFFKLIRELENNRDENNLKRAIEIALNYEFGSL